MTNTPYYGYVENAVLDSLELSVRADRVLRMYGRVNTLDDFMSLTKAEVMALKGAGMRTWGEIKMLQKNLLAHRAVQEDKARQQKIDKPREDLTALRDQAALAALPAIIQVCAGDKPREIGTETFEQMFARKAWAVADAFIAAREGKS